MPSADNEFHPDKTATKTPEDFPVAAIGASAGGLEAISQLLQSLPANLGIAYIIIQHLSPHHESLLPELLGRKTDMPVHKVEDGMKIYPDNVYVIPPNVYMSIVDGHLTLSPRDVGGGPFHPVNFFLSALAVTHYNKAIAIILSGTASDGSVGIAAIKAEGGITFAQDDSALFDGMPKSARNTGYVDFVLSPPEIANELTQIMHGPLPDLGHDGELSVFDDDFRHIYQMLDKRHRLDFSQYKQTTIKRRLWRRMTLTRCKTVRQYITLLEQKDGELDSLYNDLLINVTCFFREPEIEAVLKEKIFPALFKERDSSEMIRVWIPACSTGEEAFSFAIYLFEYLGKETKSAGVQIFATDVSARSIETARKAVYSRNELEGVSDERLSHFFTPVEDCYQPAKFIRDVCVFATHNLVSDPPFSHMDLISCRNVMIYLEPPTQGIILQALHYALKPGGFLILGRSESIGTSSDLFEQMDRQLKVFSKKKPSGQPTPLFSYRKNNEDYRAKTEMFKFPAAEARIDVDKEADKLLLSRYVQPSVLINKDLHIFRFHGDLSQYLKPASGKASLHLLKLVRDELVFQIRSLLTKTKKSGKASRKESILLNSPSGENLVTLELIPVKSPPNEPHFLMLFIRNGVPVSDKIAENDKTTTPRKTSKHFLESRINSLEEELHEAREQIRIMSEDFDATREELQSSNEEVLSSNEELQSINEELETSKEELQSANEELTTTNEELHHRNEELKETMEFLSSIIETVRQPMIVLSEDMKVRTVNKAFQETFRLTSETSRESQFFEMHNGLFNLESIKAPLSLVISLHKTFSHFEVEGDFAGAGRKILHFTALSMEQTGQNRYLIIIDDITIQKKLETALKDSERRFRLLVQNSFDIIAIYDEYGIITYCSDALQAILGYHPGERTGKNVLEPENTIVHPDDFQRQAEVIALSKKSPGQVISAEFRLKHKDGSYRVMECICANCLNDPSINGIVANYRDITDRKLLERQKEEFISIASHELRTPVTSIKMAATMLEEMLSQKGLQKEGLFATKLNQQVDRFIVLIKELLDFTRVTQGKLQLQATHFNVNDLVRELIDELRAAVTEHPLILHAENIPPVWADRLGIRRVLTNLLSNAIKYSPSNSEIVIATKAEDNFVMVSVEDSGIGVPDEMRNKIFDRFFRLTETRVDKPGGLGLGLYIAAEIIRAHGGRIWSEPKDGPGSVFRFKLPVFAPANSPGNKTS